MIRLNKRFAAYDSGQPLGLALGQMADLEIAVLHAVVVVKVGQGFDQETTGGSVAPYSVESSFDSGGKWLLESHLKQCNLRLEISGFVGI